MAEIISCLYAAAFLAAGYMAARVLFPAERPLIRLWLGGVCALLMLLWLPALSAFLFDFTRLAQYIALLLCCGIGIACALLFYKKKPVLRLSSWRQELPVLYALLPLLVVGIVLFLTHVIPNRDGVLYAGQSTFGDLPLHLGLVTSLGEQGMFPPEYSIFPGTNVGYPFLCDSISATFYVLGAGLRFSMLLPSFLAYILVLLGVYLFFECWLKKRSVAIFATYLFFVGGGFGFTYFFDQLQTYPYNLSQIFTDFYHTPTNYTDIGLIWVNPIADMLIPQRATLFGWALLFPALFLLRKAAFEGETRLFLPLGVLAGCMPLVHTHSFFALGILSFVYLVRAVIRRENKKALLGFLCYGAIAVALAAPQLLLFTFRQAGGFVQPHFNWVNKTDSALWFYIKNMGLLFLLLPVAFFRLEKPEKGFYLGAVILWLLAEFFLFQPNPYDNNKLLFVWFAFNCGLIAKLLIELYALLKAWPGRRYIAVLTLLCLFLSGSLTLGRELVSEYQLFGSDETEAAAYIKENTLPASLFLTATNHNNFVAALTGRNILCGTGSYLYFHGIDLSLREQDVARLYEVPYECFADLQQQYGIEYVVFSDYECYQYACDEAFYSNRFPLAFENDTVRIYRLIAQ